MTTIVHEQGLDLEILPRELLIKKIRAMLNAAEQGEDVVTFEFGNLQLDIDYVVSEITVCV